MEIILVFLTFITAAVVYIRIKAKQDLMQMQARLQREFGQITDRHFSEEEFHVIKKYFSLTAEKTSDFFVDDMTWNDLDMNDIFGRINNTNSSVGEEYLYAMLRFISFDQEELLRRDDLIQYFRDNESIRIQLQTLFVGLGRLKHFSVADYIYNAIDLEMHKTKRYTIQSLLLCGTLVAAVFHLAIGVVSFMFMASCNMLTYFKRKSEIEVYLNSISYIVGMMVVSGKLTKINAPKLEPFQDRLSHSIKMLAPMKRKMKFIKGGSNGSIIDAIMDYIRMFFLVDIIQYEGVVRELLNHADDIKEIYSILGYMESMISFSSYRSGLTYSCQPELINTRSERSMEVISIYHPLVKAPIANTLCESSSVLLTGSNASGKSTFLKTIAVNVIFAQTMYAVTAKRYRAPFYKVMSSMALKDNIQGRESYYMVEIKSLKRILDSVGGEVPIICFIDEVLRGTNTVERIAASTQILLHLGSKHCMCFAATHDIELTELLQPLYVNYHFKEDIREGDVLFDYVLYKGKATSRNAIHLLKILGYEQGIIDKAFAAAKHFEESGEW